MPHLIYTCGDPTSVFKVCRRLLRGNDLARMKEVRNYLDKIFNWIFRAKKRHHAFAVLLFTLGIGCFAAPAVWVQVAVIMSETLQTCIDQRPTSNGLSATDIAGYLCIISSVAVFSFFELREPRIEQKDSFNIALPEESASLKFVLDRMFSARGKPVEFLGFTNTRLQAKPKPGRYSFSTIYDAAKGVVAATDVPCEERPEILVSENETKISIRANYG
ncbi:hypothetical protein [Sagittula sp.]|uniref:hypothetical protein n=1 Tax=Sagittula sp. TaxID=2038081 RepID=UPI0040582DFE